MRPPSHDDLWRVVEILSRRPETSTLSLEELARQATRTWYAVEEVFTTAIREHDKQRVKQFEELSGEQAAKLVTGDKKPGSSR